LREILPVVYRILDIALWAYLLLLIVRVAFSWFRVNSWSRPVLLVYALTDPVMEPLRKLKWLRVGMFDFTPTLAILAVIVVKDWLLPLLFGLLISLTPVPAK
jgi:YggT family protein